MKSKMILVLSVLLLSSCVATAQGPAISTNYSDSEITELIQNFRNSRSHDTFPTGVLQQRFLQDFPNARDVEWETNNEIFEVEFQIGNRDFMAYYDSEGNLILYRQEIRVSDLPAVVRTAAEGRFPNFRFEDIYRIAKGTQTFFRIGMERGDNDVRVYITSNGEIMNRVPVY
jgi:hypothetical protein